MRFSPTLLILAVVLSPPLFGQTIRPGGPTDGSTRATCDIPPSQHMRNTGGSDGAGLCVPTSCEVVANRWHSAPLDGFQAWCQKREGGSFPEKLEQSIVQFCREKGRPIPKYVQHTGGDESLLDLSMKTGRMVGITYAGQDDFYQGETIAHMVCLVHLDDTKAAILDNNRPGQFVWMSRKQLLDRWRGVDATGRPLMVRTGRGWMQVGGGWCVVFLDAPPPPYGVKPSEFARMSVLTRFDDVSASIVGPSGTREVSRSDFLEQWGKPDVTFGQCPGGRCPPVYTQPVYQPYYQQPTPVFYPQGTLTISPPTPVAAPVATPVAEKEEPKAELKPSPKAETSVAEPKDGEEGDSKNFGVDPTKLRPGKWFHNGAEVKREEAMAAVAGELADDSERWFLICVAGVAEQTAFLAAAKTLPTEMRDRLHIVAYAPGDWRITQFGLPGGVCMRKPARGRVGEDAGRFAGEMTADSLRQFVSTCFAPPPAPMPAPAPGPQPQPPPAPEPAPPSTPFGLPVWLLTLIAVAATYFFTRRKS